MNQGREQEQRIIPKQVRQIQLPVDRAPFSLGSIPANAVSIHVSTLGIIPSCSHGLTWPCTAGLDWGQTRKGPRRPCCHSTSSLQLPVPRPLLGFPPDPVMLLSWLLVSKHSRLSSLVTSVPDQPSHQSKTARVSHLIPGLGWPRYGPEPPRAVVTSLGIVVPLSLDPRSLSAPFNISGHLTFA